MVSGVACAILGLTCARLYALCESCSLALAGLQVEQYFAVEALNYSTSAIEQLNADIGPLMSSLDSLAVLKTTQQGMGTKLNVIGLQRRYLR